MKQTKKKKCYEVYMFELAFKTKVDEMVQRIFLAKGRKQRSGMNEQEEEEKKNRSENQTKLL